MANYLLSMQFDRSGCTDKTVINLGGVSFNHTTFLGQAAYFQPYDVQSGFKIVNSHIRQVIENNNWCIYFKYKIRKEDLLPNTPLIVFCKNNEYYEFLTIENAKSFILHIADVPFALTDIDYTFDNEWHTFYAYFEDGHIKFFIDGYLYNLYYTKNKPVFGEIFYIGTDTITSNFCGYLNDFNIFEGVIYHNNFVPPSNYIYPADIMTNYKDYVYTTPDDFEPELIESIEKNRVHSASRLIEYQKGFCPRFLKLTWYKIQDGYFNSSEYKFNIKQKDLLNGIYINITGIDTTLLTNDDRYFSCNLETALELNKIHPLIVFINKKFVKLSQIKLIRSNEWHTLFIKDMDPKTVVTSLDIILLPFSVIYEEDYGERSDLQPLYIFNDDGSFAPVSTGTVFYYINDKVNTTIKHIGIREYYDLTTVSSQHMKFIWRYGKLETRRIDANNGAFMQFISSEYVDQIISSTYEYNIPPSDDYGHIIPGTKVILYAGNTIINPAFYRVVGVDLIYFENLDDVELLDGRIVTMQIITDLQEPNPEKTILQDLTDIKFTEVEATEDDQSVFEIPESINWYGIGYRKFLVFKDNIILHEYERYTVDYDTNLLKILYPRDYLAKGQHLLFIFIKTDKGDALGRVNPKPVTYLASPNHNNLSQAYINSSIQLTTLNSMIFVNNTFVSPVKYTIENNIITMKDDFQFDENDLIFVITIELVNEITDFITPRGRIINKELTKGRRFILYDLGISKKIKISLSNLVCFDQNGKLITDLNGYVYNYNIIKYLETSTPLERYPSYLICVYKEDVPENIANINRFRNEVFLKEYIHGREEFYEMDINFDQLLADFNFEYDQDLTYGENLSKALDYIVSYNQNRIDDVYEKKATAFIKDHDTMKFNQALMSINNGYSISIERDPYETNKQKTYPLFFVDGKLANWQVKENHNTTVTLDNKIPNTSVIQSINFRGLHNFLYKLNDSYLSLDKKIIKDIPIKIYVGKSLSYNLLLARIEIREYANRDFPALIQVSDPAPQIARIKIRKNILDCTIIVSNRINKNITCTIKVPLEIYGEPIDYMDYVRRGLYYDLFMQLEVLNSD